MNTSDLRYVIENSQSRSSDKLAILMNGFFNVISEEKTKDITYFGIEWVQVGTEVVPNMVTSFLPEKPPVPEDENERLKQLYEELRDISLRYDVAFVTGKQEPAKSPADSIIEVKRTDPFSEMNSITLIKNRK